MNSKGAPSSSVRSFYISLIQNQPSHINLSNNQTQDQVNLGCIQTKESLALKNSINETSISKFHIQDNSSQPPEIDEFLDLKDTLGILLNQVDRLESNQKWRM